MNKIISLEQMSDFEVYNPIITLNEDVDFDNRFVVISTNLGNIAFSYYDLGPAPDYIIHDTKMFLCFGQGYYILDLKEKCILYKGDDALGALFEIIKFDLQSCVVFIGELSVICFGLEGDLLWKNTFRYIIFDWSVTDEGLMVVFENDEKRLVLLKDGNGICIE